MAYSKTNWNDNDVITKEKMNNLETGVETANNGIPGTATTGKPERSSRPQLFRKRQASK